MDSADEKPPSISDSKGSRSPTRDNRTNFSDLHWLPIWRGGNCAGMGVHGVTRSDSLHQHKVMDMVFGEND